MAISCSGFYTVALFSPRSTMLQSTLLWYFDFFCSVTWNSPMGDYQIFDRQRTFWSDQNDLYAGIQTTQKGRPSRQAVSRCSHLILLVVSLSSPTFITLHAQSKPPCYAGYFQVKSKLCNMLGNIKKYKNHALEWNLNNLNLLSFLDWLC